MRGRRSWMSGLINVSMSCHADQTEARNGLRGGWAQNTSSSTSAKGHDAVDRVHRLRRSHTPRRLAVERDLHPDSARLFRLLTIHTRLTRRFCHFPSSFMAVTYITDLLLPRGPQVLDRGRFSCMVSWLLRDHGRYACCTVSLPINTDVFQPRVGQVLSLLLKHC